MIYRGDKVKILVNHHGKVKPAFFLKEGVVTKLEKTLKGCMMYW